MNILRSQKVGVWMDGRCTTRVEKYNITRVSQILFFQHIKHR